MLEAWVARCVINAAQDLRPLTEPVVVKTGTWDGKRWQLVVFRAGDDRWVPPAGVDVICTAVMPYASPPSASTGGALACYGSAQSVELPHWAAGPVVDSAAEVALYFSNGGVLRVPTFAAPESLGHVRFYATQIPEWPGPDSEPAKVVGIDNSGAVVACMALDPASTSC